MCIEWFHVAIDKHMEREKKEILSRLTDKQVLNRLKCTFLALKWQPWRWVVLGRAEEH